LPVHQQPAYASMNLPAGSFPVAEAFSQEEISLPIYPEMTASQVEEVVSAVRACGA